MILPFLSFETRSPCKSNCHGVPYGDQVIHAHTHHSSILIMILLSINNNNNNNKKNLPALFCSHEHFHSNFPWKNRKNGGTLTGEGGGSSWSERRELNKA